LSVAPTPSAATNTAAASDTANAKGPTEKAAEKPADSK
jgi:hypothetical protein